MFRFRTVWDGLELIQFFWLGRTHLEFVLIGIGRTPFLIWFESKWTWDEVADVWVPHVILSACSLLPLSIVVSLPWSLLRRCCSGWLLRHGLFPTALPPDAACCTSTPSPAPDQVARTSHTGAPHPPGPPYRRAARARTTLPRLCTTRQASQDVGRCGPLVLAGRG